MWFYVWMHKHENSTPSDLNSHQEAQERRVNSCAWELALAQIPCVKVGKDKMSVHISVIEEENW